MFHPLFAFFLLMEETYTMFYSLFFVTLIPESV